MHAGIAKMPDDVRLRRGAVVRTTSICQQDVQHVQRNRRPHHRTSTDAAGSDKDFLLHQINMSDTDMPQKKPRGRPPDGAILVGGKWQLTEQSLAKEAERLEKHRAQCRQRYRRNRVALMQHRPELFKKRKWQTVLGEPPGLESAAQDAEPC